MLLRFRAPKKTRESWSRSWPCAIRSARFKGRRSGLYLRVGSRCWGVVHIPTKPLDRSAA